MTTEQGPPRNTKPTDTTKPGQPMLHVDLEEFAHHLNGSNLSDEEKREYLEIFWNIVIAFVDLGFGLNPAQTPCGKLPKTPEKAGFLSGDSLDLREFTNKAKDGVQP